ncbi:HGxxPAAW family protein [Streptomyces sp. NPDC051784]|uniref:HGxxPAAW family protein n=1 Tax=Streptomyces sp. NPDC051784 TaxID=3155805 RepID=UPI003442834A
MSAHGDADLGHTLAGWTGTVLGVLGSAVLGVGLIAASTALLLAGAGVVLLAALVCWALHLAGLGKGPGPRPPREQGWRTRDRAAREGHPGWLGCRTAGRRSSRAGSAAASGRGARGARHNGPRVAPARLSG